MTSWSGPSRWAGGRLLAAVSAVAGSALLVWLLVMALPGDQATAILGQNATPERVTELRERLGIDRPVIAQFATWVAGMTRGDFGTSLLSGRPIGELIADRVVNSFALTAFAGVIVLIVGVPLGLIAGARSHRGTGRIISTGAIVIAAIPEFVLGAALVIVLAVDWKILPAVSLVPRGDTAWQHPMLLIIPGMAVGLGASGWVVRYVRAVVAEQMVAPHVVAARIAGDPESVVLARHLAPVALAPVLQLLGWLTALLVGGAVVVEQLLGFPGIGSLLVESVSNRDLIAVAGITVVLSTVVAGALLIADAAAVVIDPRLRPWRT